MLTNAVLIQESAIGTDLGGKLVYVVGDDNMVEQRYIELGPKDGGMIVAASGLDRAV